MAQKKTRVLFVDVQNNNMVGVDINDFMDITSLLDAEYFDVIYRKLLNNDQLFTIYCDDLGKLKDLTVSAISFSTGEMLVGNLVISLTDESGEMVSLSDETINDIIFESTIPTLHDDGSFYPLLILE